MTNKFYYCCPGLNTVMLALTGFFITFLMRLQTYNLAYLPIELLVL